MIKKKEKEIDPVILLTIDQKTIVCPKCKMIARIQKTIDDDYRKIICMQGLLCGWVGWGKIKI